MGRGYHVVVTWSMWLLHGLHPALFLAKIAMRRSQGIDLCEVVTEA